MARTSPRRAHNLRPSGRPCFPLALCLALTACLLCSAPARSFAPSTPDEWTSLLIHFDGTLRPSMSLGDWTIESRGSVSFAPSPAGKALQLAPGARLIIPADGKINPPSGTIEVWLKCTWQPPHLEHLYILSFSTPTNCYLNFNAISPTRLGFAIQGGPADKHVWRRLDCNPTSWRAGQWHHLAAVWDQSTMRLFLDGRQAASLSDAAAMIDVPESITIGPGPLTIDELRISTRPRSADEIAASFRGTQRPRLAFLTDLRPIRLSQQVARPALDCQLGPDDRRLPLIAGSHAYGRGLALSPPATASFPIPSGLNRFRAVAAASLLASESGKVRLTISAAGRTIWESPQLSPGSPPQPLDIHLPSAPSIELSASGDAGAVAILAQCMFLAADAKPPESAFRRHMSPNDIKIQQMRLSVRRFSFSPPPDPRGFVVYAGHPVDMLDPARQPGRPFPDSIDIFLAPGEYEAAQIIICALRDLPRIQVSCSALRGPGGSISAKNISVRLVRRVLQRRGYWMKRKPENYDIVSRFLFPNRPFWLRAGELKEVNITIHAPPTIRPGTYRGRITVSAASRSASLTLIARILPIRLREPDRQYGMYYRFPNHADSPKILSAELSDLRAHGCTTIFSYVGPRFYRDENGNIAWSLDQVRQCLQTLARFGFHGPIVILDNAFSLASLMGIRGVTADDASQPISENEKFLQTYRRALADLRALARQFPQFELLLTHMDEVFNRTRLPRYLDGARAVRKCDGFRLYMTIHMLPGRWEKPMAQSDQFIDVRCINGHSLDEWLKSGHTFDDLARILQKSGDEAWIYYNMRGSFFLPEWNRIVNGLYMWLSPIRVHVPWMYYAFGGNPFDDTDSPRYDFGYAFPSPNDPTRLISTLHWEAFREGYDDMRYLHTLQSLIAEASRRGTDTSAARNFLSQLKASLPRIPDDIAHIDLESPVLVAISRKFSGRDYDSFRRQAAEHIIRLQRALGR